MPARFGIKLHGPARQTGFAGFLLAIVVEVGIDRAADEGILVVAEGGGRRASVRNDERSPRARGLRPAGGQLFHHGVGAGSQVRKLKLPSLAVVVVPTS